MQDPIVKVNDRQQEIVAISTQLLEFFIRIINKIKIKC